MPGVSLDGHCDQRIDEAVERLSENCSPSNSHIRSPVDSEITSHECRSSAYFRISCRRFCKLLNRSLEKVFFDSPCQVN